MVADKGKKMKVAERGEEEEEDNNQIDEALVLSIEKLQEIQDELEKVCVYVYYVDFICVCVCVCFWMVSWLLVCSLVSREQPKQNSGKLFEQGAVGWKFIGISFVNSVCSFFFPKVIGFLL